MQDLHWLLWYKWEIEHGLCACTVDYPLAKARGLSLRTGAQTMLYLPLIPVLVLEEEKELSRYSVADLTKANSCSTCRLAHCT